MHRHRSMLVRAASAAAVAALAATSTATVATAASADEALLTVDHVRVYHEFGGYPILGWGFGGLAVVFTDPTPADSHTYVVTMTPTAGPEAGATLSQVYEPHDGWSEWGSGQVVFSSADVVVGVDYEVAVSEQADTGEVETSAAYPFTPAVVGHPDGGDLRAKGPSKKAVYAGSRVKLRWSGAWADDAGLTQVVLARPRKGAASDRDFIFCEGTSCPPGGRRKRTGTEPLTSFRVPKWMAGRMLTVVSYGYGYERIGGERVQTALPWGWRWDLRIKKR